MWIKDLWCLHFIVHLSGYDGPSARCGWARTETCGAQCLHLKKNTSAGRHLHHGQPTYKSRRRTRERIYWAAKIQNSFCC